MGLASQGGALISVGGALAADCGCCIGACCYDGKCVQTTRKRCQKLGGYFQGGRCERCKNLPDVVVEMHGIVTNTAAGWPPGTIEYLNATYVIREREFVPYTNDVCSFDWARRVLRSTQHGAVFVLKMFRYPSGGIFEVSAGETFPNPYESPQMAFWIQDPYGENGGLKCVKGGQSVITDELPYDVSCGWGENVLNTGEWILDNCKMTISYA